MNNGQFVISLDFELLWGVRDKRTIQDYGSNIENVSIVIPKLLSLFKSHEINATFATVGFLFSKDKNELKRNTPSIKPTYKNESLSPYLGHYDLIENTKKDNYHFATELIEEIANNKNHEIGTHTHSHYYCLEEGQTIEQFDEDLKHAHKAANEWKIKLNSIVFPRNQIYEQYLKICSNYGIRCYRGNPKSWFFNKEAGKILNIFQRGIRFLDRYINLTGHHSYNIRSINRTLSIINVPASRFLSPYSQKFKVLESLRLRRIKNEMTYAAKNGYTYHIWWHPHNFGNNIDENFNFLEKILQHFKDLNEKSGFRSLSMFEASQLVK